MLPPACVCCMAHGTRPGQAECRSSGHKLQQTLTLTLTSPYHTQQLKHRYTGPATLHDPLDCSTTSACVAACQMYLQHHAGKRLR
jgi:hypothetical protein